jgi:hypothetical protein
MQFAESRTNPDKDPSYSGSRENKYWIGLSGVAEWSWGSEGVTYPWSYWANPNGQMTEGNLGDKWIPGDGPPHGSGSCAYASNLPDTGNDGFHDSPCELDTTIRRKFICSAKRNMEIEVHSGSGWTIMDGKSGILNENNMCKEVNECADTFHDGSMDDVSGFVPGPFTAYDEDGTVSRAGLACPPTEDRNGAPVMPCTNTVGSYKCTCKDMDDGTKAFAVLIPDMLASASAGALTAQCMVETDVSSDELRETIEGFDYHECEADTGCPYQAEPVTTEPGTFAAFSVEGHGPDIMDGKDTWYLDSTGGGNYKAQTGKTGGVEVHFPEPYMLTDLDIFCVKGLASQVGTDQCNEYDPDTEVAKFDFGDIEVQYWDYHQHKFVSSITLKEFNRGTWHASYDTVTQGGAQQVLFREAPISKVWRVIFPNNLENCNGNECTAPASHRKQMGVRVSEVMITGAKKFVNGF